MGTAGAIGAAGLEGGVRGTDLHTFSWGLGTAGGHRSSRSGGRGRWRGTDLHTFSWGLGTAGAIGAAGLEGEGGGGGLIYIPSPGVWGQRGP